MAGCDLHLSPKTSEANKLLNIFSVESTCNFNPHHPRAHTVKRVQHAQDIFPSPSRIWLATVELIELRFPDLAVSTFL